ncbi:MAG: DNA polymerase IV [Clostridiaceae bacterium]|jgi:DNA polymerase-4|nr:DNA polymerase IV [Clostridiaceae bacterium]
MNRVILHSDLNNFYASVECLYNPEIRDRPVAVCGSQSTRHGIVLAKNNLAKKFGVKAGDAIWEARSKCPGLVVVRPNYMLYLRFSMLARKIYENYTNLIEAFGIDENWLDVTESTKLFGSGENIADMLRERIRTELGVTASVGVSFNKVFAKLGSDMKKPDATTVISEENYREKVWKLPVGDMIYVGPSTRRKLTNIGIQTIGELAGAPPKFLERHFGQWGRTLWIFANGYDESPVTKLDFQPGIKGIGNSLTTPHDLRTNEDVKILTYVLADSVAERLRRHQLRGRTVQIYIRSSDLSFIERQGQLSQYTCTSSDIAEKALEIFSRSWDWSKTIRTLGIRVTGVVMRDDCAQVSLFDDNRRLRREQLESSIDSIRTRFGHYSVQRGLLIDSRGLNANPVEENVIHPVSFFK